MADELLAEVPAMENADLAPGADPTPAADGHAMIARLADEVLPSLIQRITHSQLGELEVRENGWRIRLRRTLPATPAADVPADGAAPSSIAQSAVQQPPPGTLTSPAVGYFTPASGFEIGAVVRNGDALGYVDVLGVRHDVVSPIDGVVRGLEVEVGQAVEYGQPIARVEPAS
jgi:acetyl-CoA carboxylase biotin carboxyl carrier protein